MKRLTLNKVWHLFLSYFVGSGFFFSLIVTLSKHDTVTDFIFRWIVVGTGYFLGQLFMEMVKKPENKVIRLLADIFGCGIIMGVIYFLAAAVFYGINANTSGQTVGLFMGVSIISVIDVSAKWRSRKSCRK